MSYLADSSTSPYVLMLERWMLPFSYIRRPRLLLVRVLCMEIANGLFSWFKHKSICPDVKTLNATIFVHSTHKTVIRKEYCVWRLQMSYLADSSTSLYVLMLDSWMLPFLYIQRPRGLLERNILSEVQKYVFSWFKHEFICPDVRALNATKFRTLNAHDCYW